MYTHTHYVLYDNTYYVLHAIHSNCYIYIYIYIYMRARPELSSLP